VRVACTEEPELLMAKRGEGSKERRRVETPLETLPQPWLQAGIGGGNLLINEGKCGLLG